MIASTALSTRLGVTQSAVSQRIKALEERLGTTLVRRTRPATATDTGARLVRHAEDIGLRDRRLAADLASLLPAPDTALRIAVTADSLATLGHPRAGRRAGAAFRSGDRRSGPFR